MLTLSNLENVELATPSVPICSLKVVMILKSVLPIQSHIIEKNLI
jgi:hypothetical protein